jgi:hypothetical protein
VGPDGSTGGALAGAGTGEADGSGATVDVVVDWAALGGDHVAACGAAVAAARRDASVSWSRFR